MSVNLVTTDSVRAVLGVSAKELPDTILANPIYSTFLKEHLLDMSATIVDDFARVAALSSRSKDEQRFLDVIETYAAYDVAQQCVTSLPMFAPQTIKDEKAELTRNRDFYARLADDIKSVLAALRARVLAVYARINPSAAITSTVDRVFAANVGLANDPVLGT